MDPIERLQELKEEFKVQIKPRTDGVFPKYVVIRELSTRREIFRRILERGQMTTFTPPMSGRYEMDVFPVDPEEDPQKEG